MKSEIQIQSECFQWAWNTYPQTRKLLFHVPNGGKRTTVEAMQLKASGVIAGVPDMLFLWKGKWHAFEFKDDTGVLSKAQKELHSIWMHHGQQVHIVRDVPTFQEMFLKIISEIPPSTAKC